FQIPMSDLFDTLENWRLDPANAFAAFVRTPEFLALRKRRFDAQKDVNGNEIAPAQLRPSSAQIYILMFGRFLRWVSAQEKTLFEVTSSDLMAFLQQR